MTITSMDTQPATVSLPKLPVPHSQLARYISEHPDEPVSDLLAPYREYESLLRSVFAQDRQNPILEDPYVNVLPLFNRDTECITTRARNLAAESEQEKSRYIMPLPDDKRRPHGSPATVANLEEFQKNFNLFSESSLADMDWSNVVAAGSSVVNCLLPVPAKFNTTKRMLRDYYHEKFCPASDVDLFLYGLSHEEAISKIKQIERAVRDALLTEVTVVRTRHAITIASQCPVRHVQIVLRVYRSVSEILAGFDIDAAGCAYDGKQVYATPRALGSLITQVNHIDLSRRSPSYENRLSKYSHRNFEVYWPELDRRRIDPTIFERSFRRTSGLARLLVLERLPTTSAREAYLNKRREERGRPTVYRSHHYLGGNIKDDYEDEVADWVSEDASISNYHTFTIPYGKKFHAKRIEKLCYTRDLLLNAEWNQPKDRPVYLHRHPAFFGRAEDVIEDCCGTCPKPETQQEKDISQKESEMYISGKVSFLTDDPGRQQIGSFNPLTEEDWTDMAYVGNTARLCQSIVDGDIDDVTNWLSQAEADPNTRDYTGRTPLHLAVIASTPAIVKCLVDGGARLTSRLADGRTALHLAASRGDTDIIKTLMDKSIENEAADEERRETHRPSTPPARSPGTGPAPEPSDDPEEGSDEESVNWKQSDTDAQSATTGSFVKVGQESGCADGGTALEDPEDEPDYYHIDVLAWDIPCSPLHLAIVSGHEEAVRLLCNYGADSILPVKLVQNDTETAAILTLTLALSLPLSRARSMARLLLNLGAVSSQADINGVTALYKYIDEGDTSLVDTLIENDEASAKMAMNHVAHVIHRYRVMAISPLQRAVEREALPLVNTMLDAGAFAEIGFETWLKAARTSAHQANRIRDLESNKRQYGQMEQPLITAIRTGQAEIALALLDRGADPNTICPERDQFLGYWSSRRKKTGETALDLVRKSMKHINMAMDKDDYQYKKPQARPGMDEYLQKFKPGTYSHWVVSEDIEACKKRLRTATQGAMDAIQNPSAPSSRLEKKRILLELVGKLEHLEKKLLSKGAKSFSELNPGAGPSEDRRASSDRQDASGISQKPYSFTFDFYGDKGITGRRTEGYISLFDAAWAGDFERIKELTLHCWGPENDQTPLNMAIRDSTDNSPFSIAFLRGHYGVATAILEIVQSQWTPPEKDNVRFRLRSDNDVDDGSCDDEVYSDDEYDEDTRLVEEVVDKKFTIDNVGQVSMQVESHSTPLEVITGNWRTFVIQGGTTRATDHHGLFKHCFNVDDAHGLNILLDLAQYWSRKGRRSTTDEGQQEQTFTLPQEDFTFALASGKTRLLGIIIERTGAGMPLDVLVKKTGVQFKEQPKYYQGLTVYGMKRKDWAMAGRGISKSTGLKTAPLLQASFAGSIESVEFFLSDSPNRLYGAFCKSKAAKEDSRFHFLSESPGGIDRVVAKWLGANNDLVIHCAVLATPGPRACELLQYLVETCPSALDKRSEAGDTPLMVSCRLGLRQFARILIRGNADQSVRNSKGENIVHAAVSMHPRAHRLRGLLDELDPKLRTELFLQRQSLSQDGNTPIQSWVNLNARSVCPDCHRYKSMREKDLAAVLRLLLDYSEGRGLDMLNAAGNTVLHMAMMLREVSMVKTLIDFKPSLLYRENAVGRTPAEVGYDTFISSRLSRPDVSHLPSRADLEIDENRYQTNAADFVRESKAAEDRKRPADKRHVEALGLSGDYTAADVPELVEILGVEPEDANERPSRQNHLDTAKVTWDICSTAMRRNPGSRRLVSLNEANDVARRLGEQETSSRYGGHLTLRGEERPDDEKEDDVNSAEKDILETRFRTRSSRPWWNFGEKEAQEAGISKCDECGSFHE